MAAFSPTGKRLKQEDPHRLSFQVGGTSEFSAVLGFMINKHAALNTELSAAAILCWGSGQVDSHLKRKATQFREIQKIWIT